MHLRRFDQYTFSMQYVAGTVLTIDGPVAGYIGFDRKKIREYGEGKPPSLPLADGWIIPPFVNAHTHIGDTFVRKKYRNLPHNIEQLVAPPHGLKHKALEQASDRLIISGMRSSIEHMIHEGTGSCWDFREGGIQGQELLMKAQKQYPLNIVIFGRPAALCYDEEELEQLLPLVHGIGISSVSDWDIDQLSNLAHYIHKKKKLFALHASERIREDIETILALQPTFIVHMTQGTSKDFKCIHDNNIPIVVCPRSNHFFGLQSPLKLMKQHQVSLLIGTDNAMLHPPSLIEEMRFIMRHWSCFSEQDLLQMVTYSGRKALNPEAVIPFPTQQSNFVVLGKLTLEPLFVSQFKQDGYHEN